MNAAANQVFTPRVIESPDRHDFAYLRPPAFLRTKPNLFIIFLWSTYVRTPRPTRSPLRRPRPADVRPYLGKRPEEVPIHRQAAPRHGADRREVPRIPKDQGWHR